MANNAFYPTTRLQVGEIFDSNQTSDFFVSAMEILTPSVVANLPPYFQNVNSIPSAQEWLKHVVSDGRLFVVKRIGESKAIGFVFLSTEKSSGAHIGYLLGESYWGKGYATEILKGLIDFIASEDQVTRLIAGVATENVASIKLLQKMGFIHSSSEDNGTMFYEYRLSQK
jgi:RimJ/RimL family protein N-acetyltransferase